MIDTDKYKGHLAYLDYELWAFTDFMNINATHEERCATDALLNDAPLLLAEVKRLRSGMQDILDDFETTKTDMWSIIKRIQEMIE